MLARTQIGRVRYTNPTPPLEPAVQRDCMMTSHGKTTCVEAPPAPARAEGPALVAVLLAIALLVGAVVWAMRRRG